MSLCLAISCYATVFMNYDKLAKIVTHEFVLQAQLWLRLPLASPLASITIFSQPGFSFLPCKCYISMLFTDGPSDLSSLKVCFER